MSKAKHTVPSTPTFLQGEICLECTSNKVVRRKDITDQQFSLRGNYVK